MFPIELWNVYHGTGDNMPNTDNSVAGFLYLCVTVIQSSVTNRHPHIWKLFSLLMKEEILEKKEKVRG